MEGIQPDPVEGFLRAPLPAIYGSYLITDAGRVSWGLIPTLPIEVNWNELKYLTPKIESYIKLKLLIKLLIYNFQDFR